MVGRGLEIECTFVTGSKRIKGYIIAIVPIAQNARNVGMFYIVDPLTGEVYERKSDGIIITEPRYRQ